MHIFLFKLYISAVFRLIAMIFPPYNSTLTGVPGCTCVQSLQILSSLAPNLMSVGLWSSCGHCTISKHYSVRGGMVSLVGLVIWHWYALKTGLPEVNISITYHQPYFQSILCENPLSKRTSAKIHMYRFKAQPLTQC